jgi:hypothetical protein
MERYHRGIDGQVIEPKASPGNDNAVFGPIEC